jgi:hypothetical protein
MPQNQIIKCEKCDSPEVYLCTEEYSSFPTNLCYECMIKREPELADVCICGHIRDMHRHGNYWCSPTTTSEGHITIKGFEKTYMICNCSRFILDTKVPRPTTTKMLLEIIFKPMIEKEEARRKELK